MNPNQGDLEHGVLVLETLDERREGVYRAVPVPSTEAREKS